MKLNKLLYILSIIVVSIGCLFIFLGVIFSFRGNHSLSDLFLGIASILGVISVVLMITRLVLSTKEVDSSYNEPNKKVVKIVDVKDVPKSRDEELYEQYEDLYKRGLISKEDLDLKRKELLHK